MYLNGKKIVVIGSGNGIGTAIVSELVNCGAQVICVGRSLTEDLSQILSNNPESCYHYSLDLTKKENLDFLCTEMSTKHNHIDGMVFNIGGIVADTPNLKTTQLWQKYFDINLFVSVHLCDALNSNFIASKSSLVFIGSIAAKQYLGAPTPYSVAKASVNIYAKDLAKKLGEFSVRVNTINPGNVIFPDGNWHKKQQNDPETINAFLHENVALKRFGKPQEIAKVVKFLLHEDSSFITGASIDVDGGQINGYL